MVRPTEFVVDAETSTSRWAESVSSVLLKQRGRRFSISARGCSNWVRGAVWITLGVRKNPEEPIQKDVAVGVVRVRVHPSV